MLSCTEMLPSCKAELWTSLVNMGSCFTGIVSYHVRVCLEAMSRKGFRFPYDCAWMSCRLPNEELLQGWEILKTTPKENLSLVDILADSRSELAHMLGSSSYAEYALDSSILAGNPDAVVQFLAQLHQASESQANPPCNHTSAKDFKVFTGFETLKEFCSVHVTLLDHFLGVI